MKMNTIRALDELGLTREEAQEWIEMLNEKEHSSWSEVVKKHTFYHGRIETKRLVCYKNEDGSFEYHYYVDGKRASQIYAFQLGSTPIKTIKSTPSQYYLMRTVDEAKKVTFEKALLLEQDGWKLLPTEEMCAMLNRYDQDDDVLLQALYDCGVYYEVPNMQDTWCADTAPLKSYKFNVRLFKPISPLLLLP